MGTGILISLSEINENERQLIKKQLALILASPSFIAAKQMRRFLEYVVEKTLVGDGKLLKQYTIGIDALGFPDDFDSDSNPIVRILAGRVRKRLADYYQSVSDSKIYIAIPKGMYIPEFYYSNNNEKAKPSSQSKEIYTSSGPRLALLGFTDKTQKETSNQLLLEATDTLARQLSRFTLFSLVVQNPFADKSMSHDIGQHINTDYILALYVKERANQKFELTCRLAVTDNEEVVWSDSYVINNEIAVIDQENVIAKITIIIADIHQGRFHQHWARSLLLKKERIPNRFKVLVFYRQYYDNFTIETFRETVSACEVALEIDKNDIIANIVFADLCRRDYVHCYDIIESSLESGIKSAQRVTFLRQDSHVAHFTLGQLLYCKGEFGQSLEQFKIAINTSHTHGVVLYGSGYHLCLMGKWDEGISMVKKAMEFSPTNHQWYILPMFLFHYMHGRYQEALFEAQKLTIPNLPYGSLARCITYAQLGEIAKAKAELSNIYTMIPNAEKEGRNRLFRMFNNEEITEKIWEGFEKAIKE